MRKISFFIVLWGILLGGLFSVNGNNQSKTVSGYEFWDKNNNGIREKGEPAVRNLPISNGEQIVKTNRRGEYQIPIDSTRSVFPIISGNYAYALSPLQNNMFCSGVRLQEHNYCYNIPLIKINNPNQFVIGAVGDVQVDSEEEIGYAAKSVLKELANRRDLTFNLFLGDLVNEKLPFYAKMKKLLEYSESSSFLIAGNHDRYYTPEYEKQDSVFNAYFGATTYAFNQGKVHFILLNNVYPTGKRSYEGRYTDRQLEFIENDLKLVPDDYLIVVGQHIPLVATKNRKNLFQALSGKKVLVLSAHTHSVLRSLWNKETGEQITGKQMDGENMNSDSMIQEITVGTSCGHFWKGEKDLQGVPSALMQCGSPRCYFTIHFDRNNYSFKYKSIGEDGDRQADIVIKGYDECTDLPELDQFDDQTIFATIFGAASWSNVQIRIDHQEWHSMCYTSCVAPAIAQWRNWIEKDIYPTLRGTKQRMGKRVSPHVWTFLPAIPLSKGIHLIEVRAQDQFGFSVLQKQFFNLAENPADK